MKYITVALVALFPLILSAQTYTNEVAAIINDNCVVCHRSGGSRTGDEMTHAWLAITHLDDEGYNKLKEERDEKINIASK